MSNGYRYDGGGHTGNNEYYHSSTLRPSPPGTPHTFDSHSFKSGQFGASTDYVGRYDDILTALHGSPQMGSETAAGAYYFSKEGGSGAAAVPTTLAREPVKQNNNQNWIKRHPYLTSLIVLLVLVVAGAGAGIGGVFAGKSKKDSSDLASTASKPDASGSSSSNKNTTSAAPAPLTPLPKWNMTDSNQKMIGTSLGNWLVLERWLSEDWFTQTAGQNTFDEWTFTTTLGPTKAKAALLDHWNTWVQESDIDTLQSIGINSVRIPIGYWAFVDSAQGEPYLSKAGQTDQLEKVLGWLYDRKMYAMIDLHGMPGSQNGDQASGHVTDNVAWFHNANIGYSYTVLNTVIQWIQASNYSSVVHSVCPVNEPQTAGENSRLATLNTFYEAAYTMLKNAGLIMMFHHGFAPDPMNYWTGFATGKDPNYLVYNSNPYAGWFPSQSNQGNIISATCNYAQATVGFPIPVVMTEFSAINGVQNGNFNQVYYNTQVSAYSWSGGSYFWNFKANRSSNPVAALGDANMDEYSLTTLITQGIVAKVDTSVNGAAYQHIKSLPNQQCGAIPTPVWTNPSSSGAGYSGKKRMDRVKSN